MPTKMGLCCNCKFWDREKAPDARFKPCKSQAFIYMHEHEVLEVYEKAEAPDDALLYWDYEEYAADFATGPDFGCVHYDGPDDYYVD